MSNPEHRRSPIILKQQSDDAAACGVPAERIRPRYNRASADLPDNAISDFPYVIRPENSTVGKSPRNAAAATPSAGPPPDKVKRMRVFAIESPGALDLLANRAESRLLEPICKLLGHEFASTIVRSKSEFETALDHITSINVDAIPEKARKWPLCMHIAAHGNDDGLGLGSEDADWKYLGETLWKFLVRMKDYPGKIVVVLSACGAEQQKITKYFKEKSKNKNAHLTAAYVLTTVGDINWHDSVVAWSIFYHQIGAAVLDNRDTIQLILDKAKIVGAGELTYFRWEKDGRQYRRYTSKAEPHARNA